jgi:hypothetical protein
MASSRLGDNDRKLFGGGCEILLNPEPAQVAEALRKVQAHCRNDLLTEAVVLAVLERVAQRGESSAHAGVRDCPAWFTYGVSSTVIQVARLSDTLIGCSIGRRKVMPGQKGTPPVAAHPDDSPREWLHDVLSTFWTVLDDQQTVAIQRASVSRSMELAARLSAGESARRAGRVAAMRRMQMRALFTGSQPVYISELKLALKTVAEQLTASGDERITWRAFQQRWPSIGARYRRDLLEIFRQGVATTQALATFSSGSQRYSIAFDFWAGAQTIFATTQLVFQVCSPLLREDAGPVDTAPCPVRESLRAMAEHSPHPVTRDTVGWLRVHVDDHNRLVFVDEVQSDVMELLLQKAAEGDAAAAALAKELGDWHVDGFSTVKHWAAAIGYRVAMHSEESAKRIAGKTRSARKWNVYYGSLIKRFGLGAEHYLEYRGDIHVHVTGSRA